MYDREPGQSVEDWLKILDKVSPDFGHDRDLRIFVKTTVSANKGRTIIVEPENGQEAKEFVKSLVAFQKEVNVPIKGEFNEITILCDGNRSEDYLTGFYYGFIHCLNLATQKMIEIPNPIRITDFK